MVRGVLMLVVYTAININYPFHLCVSPASASGIAQHVCISLCICLAVGKHEGLHWPHPLIITRVTCSLTWMLMLVHRVGMLVIGAVVVGRWRRCWCWEKARGLLKMFSPNGMTDVWVDARVWVIRNRSQFANGRQFQRVRINRSPASPSQTSPFISACAPCL